MSRSLFNALKLLVTTSQQNDFPDDSVHKNSGLTDTAADSLCATDSSQTVPRRLFADRSVQNYSV